MSRWLLTAALLAALVLTGCGSSPTTGGGSGKGAAPTGAAGPDTGKPPETPRDTGKGAGHHDPG